MKTNDNDAAGFAEMVAGAPRTEFDQLATHVGNLSVDVDELKRRPIANEASIAQALAGHAQQLEAVAQRLNAIERYLNQQMQSDTLLREKLERDTRSDALRHTIALCPQGTDFALIERAYWGFLDILRGVTTRDGRK